MSHHKIEHHHLEKTAYVYLRQSTPTQVKNNRESQRLQRRMQEHVEKLGWPTRQIRLLGGDTGRSADTLHGRDDYQTILQAVLEQTAGLVAARELSRLVRDNQDWGQLIRLCRFQDVLLCDEHRVYDANDPQDRVMLGIQGAFNEFELAVITNRMQESRRNMARRGELYEGFPPGYICRQPPVQEKHPDSRVQRAIEKIFAEFEKVPSVYALFHQLAKDDFQIPMIVDGNDWRELTWRQPSYDQLLEMLKNPIYAGIYVRGRREVVRQLDEHGNAVKRERRVPRDQWDVYIEDHHEAYIDKHVWDRNVQKIESNGRGTAAAKGSPGKGVSLLAGLLRCHRCGQKLHVHYSQDDVRYTCRGGAVRRDRRGQRCFSFAGSTIERRIAEQILEVVSPAGIEAAELAARQLAAARQQQRQLLVDRLEAAQEAETRAARQYKLTDATYTTVRQKLAAEWDETLQKLHDEKQRLAEFDAEVTTAVADDERDQLLQLSSDLPRVWFDDETDMVLKKQIVRTLLEEIIVDLDEERDEIVLWLHWSGGHHTELRHPRRTRRRASLPDLQAIVSTLRKVLSDESLASVLNRECIPTPSGDTWTKSRVSGFRRQHKIPIYSERTKLASGWLTQAEAATKLEISPMSVSRLVESGILAAEQPRRGLPSVICEPDLATGMVLDAVRQLKTAQPRPLPHDPAQLTLFPTTNS